MVWRPLTAISFLCLGGTAQAGDKPLYQPAPAWVKPAPEIDVAKLVDADPIMLMIDHQQRIEQGRTWAYGEMALRIASPQVLTQSGTLPLPWDPAKGDLIIHSVQILRGSERIDALAGGKRFTVLQREQQLERAELNGMLTATLPVEGLRVGDVIRLSFSVTQKDPALNGHFQAVAPLPAEPMRLKFGRVRLLWPQSMPLHWRAYTKTGDAQPVDTPDGMRELVVTLPVPKPVEMPGDAPLRFRPVQLIEATDYTGWADLSKDMARLYATEGTIAAGSPLAAEVARIATATSDPRRRTAMALELVQDKVRYLYRGMDNGNYTPQAPAQTWSVRYGDCKAKSMLLLAMLRALGVEAEAALVNAEVGDLVPVRLPMPGAFNHVIVRAVIGGETLWLDGTGGGARLSDLGDVPPFRHALPLRETGSELIAMPMKANGRPLTDAELELDGRAGVLFPVPFKVQVTVRGQSAELLRVMAGQSSKEQVDDTIDNVIGNIVGSSSEVVDRSYRYDEASASARITASGVSYPDWDKENSRYKSKLDNAVGSISFSPDRARPAWRGVPVSSGDYADTRIRTRLRLPNGGTGFALEGDRTLPEMLAGVGLKREAKIEGEWITVDDRAIHGLSEVPPADIPATRAQVAQAKARLLKVVAPQDYPPLFRQVEAARKSKALDPILAIYARQIAERPEEVESYTDRAWFLERIYDRQGAIRDLDKAIALEPTAGNYLWRARLHSALKDDSKALADAHEALAIDPASARAAGQVATIMAEQGKRDEALAMLAERGDSAGEEKPTYVSAQATLLADGGRVDEGLALLDGLIAASPGKPDLLNSRCWVKGTNNVQLDSALKDCTRAIQLGNSSAASLDSRAMVYLRLNRLEDALADLDAALEEQPDQAASLYLRGIVAKRMGRPGAQEDLAAARMMWPRIDEEYARYGVKP